MPGGTLICDSAVGALMKTQGADACVVGADRVCANGDTANKIGTYTLAVVAKSAWCTLLCRKSIYDIRREIGTW